MSSQILADVIAEPAVKERGQETPNGGLRPEAADHSDLAAAGLFLVLLVFLRVVARRNATIHIRNDKARVDPARTREDRALSCLDELTRALQ